MKNQSFTSDLTDQEWKLLEPLVPPEHPMGRPRKWSLRHILNGIFYVLRGGIAWRLLPFNFPPWQTVYAYHRNWRIEGLWREWRRCGTRNPPLLCGVGSAKPVGKEQNCVAWEDLEQLSILYTGQRAK